MLSRLYDSFSDEDFESVCQFVQECGVEVYHVNEHSLCLTVKVPGDMWLQFYFTQSFGEKCVLVYCHWDSLSVEGIVFFGRLNWPRSDMGWDGLNNHWPKNEKEMLEAYEELKMEDFYSFLRGFDLGKF